MKRFLPVLALALGLVPNLHADNKHTPPPAFDPTHPWLASLDEALEQSRTTGKPILAEFR